MSNPQDPSLGPEPAQPQSALTPPVPPQPAPASPAAAQPAPPQYPAAPPQYPAPVYAQAPQGPAATTNTMAIISMISSIIGWFSFGVLCVVGVILGHISLKQIKNSGEGGRPVALTGLIVGYIGIAGWIIGLIVFVVLLGVLGASIAASGSSY